MLGLLFYVCAFFYIFRTPSSTMSYPFYQAQQGLMPSGGLMPQGGGLIPQGAVPIYGAAAPSLFPGQQFPMRGLMGGPPGQVSLLKQDTNGVISANGAPAGSAATALMLRGMRPSQSLQGGQTVVMNHPGLPPGARYILPASSQAMGGMPGMGGGMYVMQALPGGMLGGGIIGASMMGHMDPSSLMGGGQPDSPSDMTSAENQLEGLLI